MLAVAVVAAFSFPWDWCCVLLRVLSVRACGGGECAWREFVCVGSW